MRNIAPQDNSELEALEQREWRESLDYVIQQGDRGRVQRLLWRCAITRAWRASACRSRAVTPYVNTIRAEEQTPLPGSQEIERRIKSLVRWNAMAMVVRAQPRVGRHRRPHLHLRVGGHACTKSASIISSAARTRTATATSSTSRATPRPASTRARFSKAGCRSRSCTTSAASWRRAAACRRIRIRG